MFLSTSFSLTFSKTIFFNNSDFSSVHRFPSPTTIRNIVECQFPTFPSGSYLVSYITEDQNVDAVDNNDDDAKQVDA